MASLDHKYVCKYYDSFLESDTLHIVMEHAANGNLARGFGGRVLPPQKGFTPTPLWEPRALPSPPLPPDPTPPLLSSALFFPPSPPQHEYIRSKRGAPLPEATVWRFLLQTAAGLQHMHEKNILHRDIKTLNIFLDAKNDVKLGDLGVAKARARARKRERREREGDREGGREGDRGRSVTSPRGVAE